MPPKRKTSKTSEADAPAVTSAAATTTVTNEAVPETSRKAKKSKVSVKTDDAADEVPVAKTKKAKKLAVAEVAEAVDNVVKSEETGKASAEAALVQTTTEKAEQNEVASVAKKTKSKKQPTATESSDVSAVIAPAAAKDEEEEIPSAESMVRKNQRTLKKTRVWMDVMAGPHSLGRIVIELYNDCPLAFENFRSLCTGEIKNPVTGAPLTYKDKAFHVLSKDYVMGGDMKVSGTANTSIYGGPFPDEAAGLQRTHDEIGTVSLFSTKKNENDSKFLITIKPHLKHLDGQFVVIGKVVKGLRAAFALSLYGDDDGKPEAHCRIANVGRYKKGKAIGASDPTDNAIMSDSEEEEDEEEEEAAPAAPATTAEKPHCPQCGSEAKYSKRVLGKGSRWLCRNQDCKHAFWHEDDKINSKAAARLLEQQKRAKEEAKAAAAAAKLAKLEAKRLRAEERKKAFEARKGDASTETAKPLVVASAPALATRLKPARDVAGPHLMAVIQAEFKYVEEQRQIAEENRLKGDEDYKRYNKEMEEKRKEMALAKRSREEEEEEILARKKARYGDKGPRRDKNRDRTPLTGAPMGGKTKDKSRYRNRSAPPQAWLEKQQAQGKPVPSGSTEGASEKREGVSEGKTYKKERGLRDDKSSKISKVPVVDTEVEKKVANVYDANWKKALKAMKK